MTIRSLARAFVSATLLLAWAPPAAAQAAPRPDPLQARGGPGASTGDPLIVAASYSFWHFSDGNYPVGFSVDASKAVSPRSKTPLSIVGQIGVHHTSGDTFTTFLGGGRVGFSPTETVTPFVQALLGFAHTTGQTNFALEFDGGADIRLRERDKWCVRIAGGVPVFFEDEGHSTAFQFGVGISMSLGGR